MKGNITMIAFDKAVALLDCLTYEEVTMLICEGANRLLETTEVEARFSQSTFDTFQELQEYYWSMLMQYGRLYTSSAEGAVDLLIADKIGKINLSEDEKERIFEILDSSVHRHAKLVRQSIEDQNNWARDNHSTTQG